MKGGDKMSLEYVNIVFAFAVVMLLLSLVITIAVQIIVTVFGIRGRNLIWGVTKVLERSPTLKNKAREIADAALHHPAVTPTKFTATAIGSKELIAVLHDLATAENESLDATLKKELKDVLDETIPLETRAYAETLAREFKALFPTEAEKMNEVLNLVKKKTLKLKSNFEGWFDTVMNRTTDRFVIHTRIFTIVFAILLAGGLQIDSLELIKTLSTDVALRNALIKSADRTLDRAGEILLSKSIPVEALESVRDKFEALKAKTIPNTLATRNDGLAWLTSELAESGKLAEIKEAYLKEFDRLTPQRLERLGKYMLEVKDQVEVSSLVFLPGSWSAYLNSWKKIGGHIPGIILSALLLSLGAPFWFNALRSIATLRTILAGKTDPSKSAEN